MTFEQSRKILDDLINRCRGDEDLEDLKEDVLGKAVKYAQMRVKWLMSESEERREMDEARTMTHNVFIDSLNALSRLMEQKKMDVSWRNTISNDRKIIGDFACYIHAVLGLKAR